MTAWRPAAGFIHHADHGCRSTALAVGQPLEEAGIRLALGAGGEGFDHAVAESVVVTVKVARWHRPVWPPRVAARLAIVEEVAGWETRQWRPSTRA